MTALGNCSLGLGVWMAPGELSLLQEDEEEGSIPSLSQDGSCSGAAVQSVGVCQSSINYLLQPSFPSVGDYLVAVTMITLLAPNI